MVTALLRRGCPWAWPRLPPRRRHLAPKIQGGGGGRGPSWPTSDQRPKQGREAQHREWASCCRRVHLRRAEAAGTVSGGAACSGPHLRAIPGGGKNILRAEQQVEVCVRFHIKAARSGSEKAGGGAVVHLLGPVPPRTGQTWTRRRPGLGARIVSPEARRARVVSASPCTRALRCKRGGLFCPHRPPPQRRPCLRGRSLFTPGRAVK